MLFLFCTTNIVLPKGPQFSSKCKTKNNNATPPAPPKLQHVSSTLKTTFIISPWFISHVNIYINPAPGLCSVYCCRRAAVRKRKRSQGTQAGSRKPHVTCGRDGFENNKCLHLWHPTSGGVMQLIKMSVRGQRGEEVVMGEGEVTHYMPQASYTH